jgi:peptide/nickel transport system permease protein
MFEYTLRRIFLGLLTAILVSLFIFAALRIAPGDVALTILGADEGAVFTDADVQALREELGLNAPLPVQYLSWMRDMVTINWGRSLLTSMEIWPSFKSALPITLELVVISITLSTFIGIPMGILMALKQDTWIDYAIRVFSLAGLSVPNFWSATMIIVFGMIFFNWGPRLIYVSPFEDPLANLQMFIWPAVAGGWASSATKSRMMRSTTLEVMRQDYIRTARAKGLKSFTVTYRHVMKNALLPVVTVIGISIALAVGGSVIMETIFMLPGIGRFLIEGLQTRDYPVVQTLTLVFSLWVVSTNLMVDLTYAWLDPRIRFD